MSSFITRLLRLSSGICIVLTLSSNSFGVNADLSDWVGLNNTASPNNYTVSGSTVGGTFAERRLNESSLSDITLQGGPFNWNATLDMSGTVSYPAAPVDPVLFFGWYHSTNLNERIGIGLADPIPVGSGIRWQTQSGNVAGTGVVSQNFGSNTTNSTYATGTYPFTFHYDGSGHMTGTFNGVNFARNYALPNNAVLAMDKFGLLQKSTSNNDATFQITFSNISYTGQTDLVTAVDADFNNNNFVDAADYPLWRKGGPLQHEVDSPGIVNGQDYTDWQTRFGNPTPGSGLSANAIPEPCAFVSLALLLSATALVRGRTSHER
jgi:hypothetical protein